MLISPARTPLDPVKRDESSLVQLSALHTPDPQLPEMREVGRGIRSIREVVLLGGNLGDLAASTEPAAREVFERYRLNTERFIRLQEERFGAEAIDAEALSKIRPELNRDSVRHALDSGAIAIERRAAGVYLVFSSEAEVKLLTEGSQAAAGRLKSGISVIVLNRETAGIARGYLDENIPHELQHLLWDAWEPALTLRGVAHSARKGAVVSPEQLDFAMFRDEVMAKLAGGAQPLGYGAEGMIRGLQFSPSERERLATLRGATNDLLKECWLRAGKGADAEELLLNALVLARTFGDLQEKVSRTADTFAPPQCVEGFETFGWTRI